MKSGSLPGLHPGPAWEHGVFPMPDHPGSDLTCPVSGWEEQRKPLCHHCQATSAQFFFPTHFPCGFPLSLFKLKGTVQGWNEGSRRRSRQPLLLLQKAQGQREDTLFAPLLSSHVPHERNKHKEGRENQPLTWLFPCRPLE